MCNPLKNISFKVPLFETGKKKVGPGLPMPWHNRTPTRISLPVPCRRLPPPQRLRAADRDNEPLSDVAEAPGQREEPEKPIRPPPEHPRAKAQPGRGGPLVCPALREWDGAAGQGRPPRRVPAGSAEPARGPAASPPRGPTCLGAPRRSSPLLPALAPPSIPAQHPPPQGEQSSVRPRTARPVRVEREDNTPAKRAAW